MRLMTIRYKVAAREKPIALPERIDEAIVMEVGCGFAHHLSISMWGGELICTISATAGHATDNVITKIKADSPIEVKRNDIANMIFCSWLEKDLVDKLKVHKFILEEM